MPIAKQKDGEEWGHTANECFGKKREINNHAIQNQELRRDNYRRSCGTAKRVSITEEEDADRW